MKGLTGDGRPFFGDFSELVIRTVRIVEKELAKNPKKRPVGRPKKYLDALILAIACIREIFQLTYRATEGVAIAIFNEYGLQISDYSTIERRIGELDIPSSIDRRRLKGNIAIMIDSAEFKVSGEGEWKVRKHGASKRRAWVKVHYLVDFSGEQALGILVTPDYIGDNLAVPDLLE